MKNLQKKVLFVGGVCCFALICVVGTARAVSRVNGNIYQEAQATSLHVI